MSTEKPRFTTIDEYIASFPDDEVRSRLQTVRQAIKDEAPAAEEAISYQIPAFKLRGQPLIHFSAAKRHIALYPWTEEMVAAIPELSQHQAGKGTIQFAKSQPLPLPLIRQIVAFRASEIGHG